MAQRMQSWAVWLIAGAGLMALFGLSVWGLTGGPTVGPVEVPSNSEGAPSTLESQADARAPSPDAVQMSGEADGETQEAQDGAPEGRVAPPLSEPGFDVVRVAPGGSSVIAGLAAPGAKVTVMVGGNAMHETMADGAGNFVAMFDLPLSDDGRDLWLEMERDGQVTTSAQTLLIAPSAPLSAVAIPDAADEGPAAPQLVLTSPDGAEVVQGDVKESANSGPSIAPLSLDSIAYSEQGEVALAGRSSGAVRVYLDGAPVGLAAADKGQWKLPLPDDVQSGVYTLRLDELSPQGAVTGRVETPFKRENAAVLAAATKASGGPQAGARAAAITVQHGATLWAISEARYGDGLRYVQVFAANRDVIRDPDLIYPGQVFSLPE